MKKLISAMLSSALFLCSLGTVNSVSAEETNSDKIRVMPLGDSITDGFWLTGGYRTTLCDMLEENGYSDMVDMVGPNWGGDCYDPQHAGYSGYSIDNIDQSDSISGARTGISSFADWLMQENPADVIMLQIGTNDILSYYDLDNICVRLENLVNQLLNYIDDDGMIYVATIPCMDASNTLYISEYYFTVDSMDAIVDKYNSEIKQMVSRLQAEGKNVALSDVNSVLDKSDLYDGVHPSAEGYEKMGQHWYKILTDYINGSHNPEQTETSQPDSTEVEPPESDDSEIIPPAKFDKGDINKNNKIDIFDFSLLKNIILDNNSEYNQYADINDDSVINIVDLTLLKQIILKIN